MYQPAHHFGVQYLAQGDLQLGEPGIQTSDLRVAGQPALPPLGLNYSHLTTFIDSESIS